MGLRRKGSIADLRAVSVMYENVYVYTGPGAPSPRAEPVAPASMSTRIARKMPSLSSISFLSRPPPTLSDFVAPAATNRRPQRSMNGRPRRASTVSSHLEPLVEDVIAESSGSSSALSSAVDIGSRPGTPISFRTSNTTPDASDDSGCEDLEDDGCSQIQVARVAKLVRHYGVASVRSLNPSTSTPPPKPSSATPKRPPRNPLREQMATLKTLASDARRQSTTSLSTHNSSASSNLPPLPPPPSMPPPPVPPTASILTRPRSIHSFSTLPPPPRLPIFVYGFLSDTFLLSMVLPTPTAFQKSRAHLEGWSLRTPVTSNYPALAPSRPSTLIQSPTGVNGLLLDGLSKEDRRRVKQFHPHSGGGNMSPLVERVHVRVQLGSGEFVNAITYAWKKDLDLKLSEEDWDPLTVQQSSMSDYLVAFCGMGAL